MDFFFAVLAAFYLAYQLGKQDGKWGCFITLAIIFGMALLIAVGSK